MCIQGLQSSSNISLNAIIEKMFTVISPPVKKSHSRQCQKCAVVGNSGNLLQSKYGALIDSHSTVFRYAPSYCSTISKVFVNLFLFFL